MLLVRDNVTYLVQSPWRYGSKILEVSRPLGTGEPDETSLLY